MSELDTIVTNMTQAAGDLLDILTEEQRQQITLPFGDEEERRKWFYTPQPRRGLPLVFMTPRQQQRVTRLLATGLSSAGYNYVSTILGLK